MTTNQELRKLADGFERSARGIRQLCAVLQDDPEADPKVKRYESAAKGIRELLDRIDRLEAENERLKIIADTDKASADKWRADNVRAQEAFRQIKSWSEAYPLSVFPEPDFEKAHQVLTANGMTLDAISASNMRHVITQVQAIVDAAIHKQKETP